MARIRSIKPEFSTDGNMLRLSDSCALFFILLWNHCDDGGKHVLDINQLVAELGGRWSKDKVRLFITCLIKSGQLIVSSDSGWLQVVNWSHQKIDKPRQPKIKSEELQWLDIYDSPIALESSKKLPRKDRIGEDRIGEDRIGSEGVPKAVRKRPASNDEKSLGSKIFEAYQEAYRQRYQKDPIRNATVNTQCGQIGSRLGEDAIEVAKFYVGHNRQFYVLKSHPIGLMLSDAEGLHTEWFNGKQTTITEARAAENKQQTVNAFSKFLKPEGVT